MDEMDRESQSASSMSEGLHAGTSCTSHQMSLQVAMIGYPSWVISRLASEIVGREQINLLCTLPTDLQTFPIVAFKTLVSIQVRLQPCDHCSNNHPKQPKSERHLTPSYTQT